MKEDRVSIEATHEKFLSGELTPSAFVDATLAGIREKNPEWNVFLHVNESAKEEAKASTDRFANKNPLGPLDGIPIAIKDNIVVHGMPATAASKILENYIGSYDATVISKLKSAGAIIIGKTNLDEFAMGSSTENSAFGPTRNPHDPSRVPGGSSGGSAAAVAGNLTLAALGSDTGGSIRQPAAFCGVVGLKPTYGSVSRSGLIAMASSLDVIGPITKTVNDARLVFNAIRGRDPLDATSRDATPLQKKSEKPVIGIPQEFLSDGLDERVKKNVLKVVQWLKQDGYEVKDVHLPHISYSLPVYYILMPAEVSANLARYDGIRYGYRSSNAKNLLEVYEKTRGEAFGAETKRRIMLGTFTLSHGYIDAYYLKAQKVRNVIRNEFSKAFESVDVLLGPTTPTPAFRIGEKTDDPLKMYLQDIFTVGANLAGIPSLSIPSGWIDDEGTRLPVGIQLMGQWFDEPTLFRLGNNIEALQKSEM